MAIKRILNPTTGRYYALRQKTTANGTIGQIMGLWSPKKTSTPTASQRYIDVNSPVIAHCDKCGRPLKEKTLHNRGNYEFQDPYTLCFNCAVKFDNKWKERSGAGSDAHYFVKRWKPKDY